MAVGYGKGVIDIIYNFILENLENESKKTPKKYKRAKRKKEDKCEEAVRKTKAKYEAAASKAGEKCEKIEDIDWRSIFYSLVNLKEYADFFKETSEDDSINNNKIVPISVKVRDEWGKSILKQVREKGGAFTWKLKTEGCELEDKMQDFYEGERHELVKKQKAFRDVIEEIDNDQEQIKNIFCYAKVKREEWRFSAIDAEKFYEDLEGQGTAARIGIKFYNENCSSEAWKDKCDLLGKIVEEKRNLCSKEKHVQYMYLRDLEELLWQLVPVCYETDEGTKLKSYEQWEKECERIRAAIHKKRDDVGLDKCIRDVIDRECDMYKFLYENDKYEEYEREVLREKYIDLIYGADEYFRKKIELVHNTAKNLEVKTKMDYDKIYDDINF